MFLRTSPLRPRGSAGRSLSADADSARVADGQHELAAGVAGSAISPSPARGSPPWRRRPAPRPSSSACAVRSAPGRSARPRDGPERRTADTRGRSAAPRAPRAARRGLAAARSGSPPRRSVSDRRRSRPRAPRNRWPRGSLDLRGRHGHGRACAPWRDRCATHGTRRPVSRDRGRGRARTASRRHAGRGRRAALSTRSCSSACRKRTLIFVAFRDLAQAHAPQLALACGASPPNPAIASRRLGSRLPVETGRSPAILSPAISAVSSYLAEPPEGSYGAPTRLYPSPRGLGCSSTSAAAAWKRGAQKAARRRPAEVARHERR